MTRQASGAPSTTASPSTGWALLVGVLGVAALLVHAQRASPVPSLSVGPVLATYRAVAQDLPPAGRIAFISSTTGEVSTSAQQYLAQHALAPRALVPGVAGVSGAVTGLAAPTTLDAELAASGLTLVRVTAEGVRVYRR